MIPQKWGQPATFTGLLFCKFLNNSIIIHGFLEVNIHERQARLSFCRHGGPQGALNQL